MCQAQYVPYLHYYMGIYPLCFVLSVGSYVFRHLEMAIMLGFYGKGGCLSRKLLLNTEVITIDTAPFGYELENIELKYTKGSLFIDAPDILKERKDFDINTSGKEMIENNAFTHIPQEIMDLIPEKRQIVSRKFEQRLQGHEFNRKKYGVISFTYSRSIEGEQNTLNAKFHSFWTLNCIKLDT